MTAILAHNLRLGLFAAQAMTERGLDDRLLEHGAVGERDGEGVWDGPRGRVVVRGGEGGVLDARDATPQGFDQRRRGGFGAVGVVRGEQAVVDEHDGDHVLDAVVAVGEVVHGFVLLVDDADTGFMGADGDGFDVLGGFIACFELREDGFCCFNSCLRVEFRCSRCQIGERCSRLREIPGYETLNSTFSIT